MSLCVGETFWKAVELQLLHRHTLHHLSRELEINFLEATHSKDRERAIFFFLLKHYYTLSILFLHEHAHN